MLSNAEQSCAMLMLCNAKVASNFKLLPKQQYLFSNKNLRQLGGWPDPRVAEGLAARKSMYKHFNSSNDKISFLEKKLTISLENHLFH